MTLVIGAIDDEHRPLRPMLTPQGIRDCASESMVLRGFAFWSRFCGGAPGHNRLGRIQRPNTGLQPEPRLGPHAGVARW